MRGQQITTRINFRMLGANLKSLLADSTRQRLVLCHAGRQALPVDLLAKTVAHINGNGIHEQRHGQQDGACCRGIDLESGVGMGHPIDHLDGHDREWVVKSGKAEVEKFTRNGQRRQEADDCQRTDGDDRRGLTHCP